LKKTGSSKRKQPVLKKESHLNPFTTFKWFSIGGLSGAFYGRNRQVAAALRESEKKFRELSITDDLTGLYNSRHFFSD
jgi:hypothetical protein